VARNAVLDQQQVSTKVMQFESFSILFTMNLISHIFTYHQSWKLWVKVYAAPALGGCAPRT